MRHLILTAALLFIFPSVTSAQELAHSEVRGELSEWVIPPWEWTAEARRWTIVAMIAESGFLRDRKRKTDEAKHRKEQLTLVFILAKRYYTRINVKPDVAFVDIVRDFCNGLKKRRTYNLNTRQKWLWELNPDANIRPKHFPKRLDWGKHSEYLNRTVVLIDKWVTGEYKDPCPKARTWGAKSDPIISKRAYPLHNCTWKRGNVLYGIRGRD